MKIIHLCQFLGVGGLEKVLYSLIKQQSKKHNVELIVYDHDRRWVDRFKKLGITVHTDYLKKPGYDLNLLKYLKEKTKNFDIIHTHDLNPMMYMGLLKLFNPHIRLVHTTHGMEHLKTTPKTNLFEYFLALTAKAIICVSPKFTSFYKRLPFINKEKIFLIDNGTEIPPPLEKSKKEEIKDDVVKEFNLDSNLPLAIYVARVSKLKGQLELIDSFKNINHQLLLVGPASDENYFIKCKKLENDKIKIIGGRNDISRLLWSSDYFISNSYHEGLPIAVLEAGARNIPCILSNIPGHATFNQHKEVVLLFDHLKDLPQILKTLDKNTTYYQKEFKKLIEQNYSSSKMAQSYEKVYLEALC